MDETEVRKNLIISLNEYLVQYLIGDLLERNPEKGKEIKDCLSTWRETMLEDPEIKEEREEMGVDEDVFGVACDDVLEDFEELLDT